METVKLLIDSGAELNSTNHEGQSPLTLATRAGENTHIVQLLIEKGADVNIKNNEGETALFHAARRGDLGLMIFLIEMGAHMNTKNTGGDSLLTIAVDSDDVNVVKLVIESGAHVNSRNNVLFLLFYDMFAYHCFSRLSETDNKKSIFFTGCIVCIPYHPGSYAGRDVCCLLIVLWSSLGVFTLTWC
eukprot:GHVR01163406.1.p1 GENE.GHVR01163406.1~~GHVR01163406.1.p1  ORF type:complete len:187 (+),score=21.13 GHVR01163406.1:523-1083(+)